MKRFEALDGLRGICALIVVLFHIHVLQSFAEHSFFRNGRYFVEFFFVLSGFVLFYTYGSQSFTAPKLKGFLTSRTFRIFPMHVCMLIFFIAFEFVKLYCAEAGFRLNNEPFDGATAPAEILPNLLLLQAWLPGADMESFNSVSWSISVEFYIYIIFALIIYATPKLKSSVFLAIVLFALAALHLNIPGPRAGVLSGLSCFFIGCLAYSAYKVISGNKRFLPGRPWFTVLELCLAAAIFFLLKTELPAKRLSITLLFALTVVVFAFESGPVSRFLKWAPVEYLGRLSYSIYITHYGILTAILGGAMVAGKVLQRNITPMVGKDNGEYVRYITTGNLWLDQLFVLAIIALVIGVSGLTYRFIELKWINIGKKLKESSRHSIKVFGKDEHTVA